MDFFLLPTAKQAWIMEQLQGLPQQQQEGILEAVADALEWTWVKGFEDGQE
jgi:hypothetical protein